MDKAKLFMNGRSQAVRLPRQYAMPGDEVYVKKLSGIVMLIPKNADPWQPFLDSLTKFSADFMNERDQGTVQQRKSL